MSARKTPPPQVQNKSKNTRRKWILWTSAVVIGAALMGEQWLALLLLLAGIIFFGTIIVASFHDHFIEGRGLSRVAGLRVIGIERIPAILVVEGLESDHFRGRA